MSIRLLAKELYHSQQVVERLEKALEAGSPDQRGTIESALRKARVQVQQLKRALDGRIGR